MKEKIRVIKKVTEMECYSCRGKGNIPKIVESVQKMFGCEVNVSMKMPEREICSTCKGTGIWLEEHFIIVNDKRKIAFDTDNMGK